MSNSPLHLSTFASDASAELEGSSITKGERGYIGKVTGRIDSTAATDEYYFQLINASSIPADGVVQFLMAPIRLTHTTGTSTNFDIDFTPKMLAAGTGIVWCVSTTEFTKTAAGAVASVTVLYN